MHLYSSPIWSGGQINYIITLQLETRRIAGNCQFADYNFFLPRRFDTICGLAKRPYLPCGLPKVHWLAINVKPAGFCLPINCQLFIEFIHFGEHYLTRSGRCLLSPLCRIRYTMRQLYTTRLSLCKRCYSLNAQSIPFSVLLSIIYYDSVCCA